MDFKRGTKIDTLIIAEPRGWVVDKAPHGVSIESCFGSQVITTEHAESMVEIVITTTHKAGSMPAEKIQPFADI